MKIVKIDKYILFEIYYLLLAVLFMSWHSVDTVPGGAMRLGFLAALVIPPYFFEKKILPAVMALFLCASTHGYTTSYMPAMMYTYVVLLPIGLALFRPNRIYEKVDVSRQFMTMLVFVTLINIATSIEFQAISEALIITMCLLCYIDYSDEKNLHLMSCVFMSVSIMLSYNLIEYGGIINSITMFNEERTGFQDINYSGCVVSLGCMAAIVELFKNSKNKIILVLCVATLIISIIALALNASRASLLSIAVVFVILSTTSKTKFIYRALVIIAVIYGLWYMYNNDYFALLEKRIEMDEGRGGTGRVQIWKIKLNGFIEDSNFFQYLIGWGYTDGRELGMGQIKTYGFHNDYLAFLVEYGIIGAVLFFRLYFYPLWNAFKKKKNLVVVTALTCGLMVICFTLEPFAAGRVPYYFFWFYILWWAMLKPKAQSV